MNHKQLGNFLLTKNNYLQILSFSWSEIKPVMGVQSNYSRVLADGGSRGTLSEGGAVTLLFLNGAEKVGFRFGTGSGSAAGLLGCPSFALTFDELPSSSSSTSWDTN